MEYKGACAHIVPRSDCNISSLSHSQSFYLCTATILPFSNQFHTAEQLLLSQNIFLRSTSSSVIFLITLTITCRLFCFMGGPLLDFVFSLFPTSYLLHHFGIFLGNHCLFSTFSLLYWCKLEILVLYGAGWYRLYWIYFFNSKTGISSQARFQFKKVFCRAGATYRKRSASSRLHTRRPRLPLYIHL